MKSLAVAALTLGALALAAAAHAGAVRHAGNIGVGLGGAGSFGNAGVGGGGLSVKYFTSDSMAIQGLVNARGGSGYSWLGLNGDYLLEQPALGNPEGLEIAWCVGPGLGLGLATYDTAGGTESWVAVSAGGVAGLEFNLEVIPLDIVLEYRPSLVLLPDLEFALVNFGGQVRYYFK